MPSGKKAWMSPLASLPWDVLLNPEARARHEAVLRGHDQFSGQQELASAVVTPRHYEDLTSRHGHSAKGHEKFHVYPQTLTNVPGAVIATHTRVDVDNDGHTGDVKVMHAGHHNPELSTLPKGHRNETIDPTVVPYFVYGTTETGKPHHKVPTGLNNHGLKSGDFAVAVHNHSTVGGPLIDSGHSVMREASIKVHAMLGRDVGPHFKNGIDSGQAVTIGFPGSRTGFTGKYTPAEIDAYAAKVYDAWAATHRKEVAQYGLPTVYDHSAKPHLYPNEHRIHHDK